MKGKVTDMSLGREAGARSYRVLWAVGWSLDFKNKCKTLMVPSDLCSEKIFMISYPIKTIMRKHEAWLLAV